MTARVNPYTIRRIVDAMPYRSTEAEIRAKVQNCCVPLSSPEFVERCQASALRYWNRLLGKRRAGL